MTDQANDAPLLKHIKDLVAEEHRLMEHPSPDDTEATRLAHIQVELDQYWDLLRQRRALREIGRESSEAHIRPAGTVEQYEG